MKYRLPILLAVAIPAASFWLLARADPPAQSARPAPPDPRWPRDSRWSPGPPAAGGEAGNQPALAAPPAAPELSLPPHETGTSPDQPPPAGDALLLRSIRHLRQQPSLEARVRQRLWLYGHQFIGSGHYRQLRRVSQQGAQDYLLWELKMEFNGRITSLKQVSDSRYLWIHRNFPDRLEQGLIDLRRVQQARRRAAERPVDPAGLSATPAMVVGGLPELLHGLHQAFQWPETRADKLGPYDVWVLHGYWKRQPLEGWLPEQRDSGQQATGARPTSEQATDKQLTDERPTSEQLRQLPAHLPHRVVLVLGRDPAVPLFPYRLEFQRLPASDGAGGGADGAGEYAPLLRMEFFEIRRTPLAREQFTFDPGDRPVRDETREYLGRLGLVPTDAHE